MYVCVCTYAYINMQIHTNLYRIRIRIRSRIRIRIRDRIRNSLKSRIRIRDRIRNKSFRIHNMVYRGPFCGPFKKKTWFRCRMQSFVCHRISYSRKDLNSYPETTTRFKILHSYRIYPSCVPFNSLRKLSVVFFISSFLLLLP